MKRFFGLVSVIILVFALAAAFTPAAASKAGTKIPGQYIVVFKDSVVDVEGKANALAAQHGLTVQRTYAYALKGFAAKIPDARLAKLRTDPDIAFIDQDTVMSIAAQTTPTGIMRIGGQLNSTQASDGAGSVNVDVAIIDSGIATHPDLNIVNFVNCSGGSPMRGSCKTSSPADGNGHGTHVAGTVGAKAMTLESLASHPARGCRASRC